MDVRAKQRLSYQRSLVKFYVDAGGFAPRHFNRYTARSRGNAALSDSSGGRRRAQVHRLGNTAVAWHDPTCGRGY